MMYKKEEKDKDCEYKYDYVDYDADWCYPAFWDNCGNDVEYYQEYCNDT